MMSEQESQMRSDNMIEVPASTPWPFVTAFGFALIFAGLVTSLAVSVVGLVVLLAGAVGWFRNVMPVQQEELVKVERPLRVAAVPRSTRRVDHLRPGEGGHRIYIPVQVHPYSAGLLGGAIGGVGMAVIACLYGLLAHGSIWYPVNLLAAAALPSLTNAGPDVLKTFQMSAFLIALLSHIVISLFVGLLFAAILPLLPSRFTAFWGSFLAPVLWT
jgi:hypothetical protein